MAFDINEARAIIEDAKKRGLISAAGSQPKPAPADSAKSANPEAKEPPKKASDGAVIPDWLQKGIADTGKPGSEISNDHLFNS